MIAKILKFLFELAIDIAKYQSRTTPYSSWLRQKVKQVKNKKVTGMVIVKFDERTCKVCRPKHGKTFMFPGNFTPSQAQKEVERIMQIVVEGGSPRVMVLPKYHPNCRCTIDLKIV
jgi:hypothetical protein